MGIRFRKSITIAPGVRFNLNKKSVGVSVGNKYGGVSYNTRTGARARVSAPGTGLSYSEKLGGSKQTSVGANRTVKEKNKWVAFWLCLLLGFFGAHKFYEGKTSMGLVYLCTIGLFGFGWILDIIIYLLKPTTYLV